MGHNEADDLRQHSIVEWSLWLPCLHLGISRSENGIVTLAIFFSLDRSENTGDGVTIGAVCSHKV